MCGMVVRFVCVIRVIRVSRVSTLSVPAPPGVLQSARYCTVPVDSGLAAVLAAVESVAVFVRVCVFGFGWMVVRFVRVIRMPACARVSRVSRVCPGSPRCLFTGVFEPYTAIPRGVRASREGPDDHDAAAYL